ncbi:alpha-L-fucosidase [Tenacibaculum sp. UWU-22]|uniref:alpha-L-fucosidase n=1 Tax=Tenacibaculum sp. UWU-22 TaxID=3234187 RepID=UPI0034DAC195
MLHRIPTVMAQENHVIEKRTNISLKYGAHRLGKRTDKAMETWRNYGLGQFIHWGVYSIPGGYWNGKYYLGAAEWIRSWKEVPNKAYDTLYKKFNPKNFDAMTWAKKAQNMGVKYVIITTKHHDGFCMWPSKYTNYSIANTPYKKDVIEALVNAYNQVGIDVYLYFSIIDWKHKGYRSSLKNDQDRKAYEKFKQFTKNQLVELLKRYPSTKGLWFDGTWDDAWKEQAAFVDSLGTELRTLVPGLIIGSRFRPDDLGNRHFDANGNMMGDYEQGWERKLPKSIEDVHGNDWDCVMTIPENQWGYHSDWRGHIKTVNELIEMMVKSVSLDGNFVLNFGPNSMGVIRPEETKIASEIGKWMRVNNQAIYNCGYLNWEKQDWGYYTTSRKTNEKYMVVFNLPVSRMLKVRTPNRVSLSNAYFNDTQKQELTIEKIRNNEYYIHLPKDMDSDTPFVIVINDSISKTDSENYQKAKI